MIVRAILARAVRFAIDGLEGAAHEGARESLELRLAESDRLLSVVEGKNDELQAALALERAGWSDERAGLIVRAEKAEARVAELADRALDTSERDALAAELAAIRAATGEETDDALRDVYDSMMSPSLSRRALYNLGRTAAQGEVARMRDEVATLRARVAELEVAPQGQPVATDEELRRVGEEAYESDPHLGTIPSRAMAYAAVARHVRAERPACLVARAVALGCDVIVANTPGGWDILAAGERNSRHAALIRPADVPATLSRLLDEQGRAMGRKGGV